MSVLDNIKNTTVENTGGSTSLSLAFNHDNNGNFLVVGVGIRNNANVTIAYDGVPLTVTRWFGYSWKQPTVVGRSLSGIRLILSISTIFFNTD